MASIPKLKVDVYVCILCSKVFGVADVRKFGPTTTDCPECDGPGSFLESGEVEITGTP